MKAGQRLKIGIKNMNPVVTFRAIPDFTKGLAA